MPSIEEKILSLRHTKANHRQQGTKRSQASSARFRRLKRSYLGCISTSGSQHITHLAIYIVVPSWCCPHRPVQCLEKILRLSDLGSQNQTMSLSSGLRASRRAGGGWGGAGHKRGIFFRSKGRSEMCGLPPQPQFVAQPVVWRFLAQFFISL